MMRILLPVLSVLFLGLVSCVPKPATEPTPASTQGPVRTIPENVGSLTASECASYGGTMQHAGRMNILRCVVPYPDAGKTCSDGDDCQGQCRVDMSGSQNGAPETGTCQVNTSIFGCYSTLEDGRRTPAICVD
jgi:hypothetical protein